MTHRALQLPLAMIVLVAGVLTLYMGQQNSASARGTTKTISLPNLDFRNGTEGWSFRGQGKPEFDDNFRAAQTPEGGVAMEMAVAESSPEYLRRSIAIERRDFPVEDGYYRLRFRMRTDLSGGFAYPQLFVQHTDGSHAGIISPETVANLRVSGQTPWTQYSVPYQMPRGADVASMSFKVDLAEGSATFADVHL